MPTREGTVLGVVAAAVFFLATNLMSGLLFVLFALLAALLAVGTFTAVWPLRHLTATRRAPLRGVEGCPVWIELTIASRRGARLLVVEDGWPRARGRAFVPALEAGKPEVVGVEVRPPRRGRFGLGPAQISSRGLVGLFTWRRRAGSAESVVIWPRAMPVPASVFARLLPSGDGQSAAVRTREAADLYGVRDYRPGDNPAHIHWKTSARRGALVVREFERARETGAAIVVDLDRSQPPDRLDAGVRAAASLFESARAYGLDVTVAGWDGSPVEHRQREAAMDWLATVAPGGPPVAEVLSALRRRLRRHLIVVAAAPTVVSSAGVTVLAPADLAGSHYGLVYTIDGMVQECSAGAA